MITSLTPRIMKISSVKLNVLDNPQNYMQFIGGSFSNFFLYLKKLEICEQDNSCKSMKIILPKDNYDTLSKVTLYCNFNQIKLYIKLSKTN